MRATLVKWGLTALLAVWLGSFGGSLHADQPETFEPGTGKYILVLEDPRTDADDPATGKKKAKEPDVAKHGGKVLKKKDAVRVIKLPTKAAKALRKEENVAYVQRVWIGESQDNWGEDDLTSELAADGEGELEAVETDLTWTTGQYLYDGSGNIKQIGSDTYRYDSAGRLIQAVVKGATESYKYDAFGNLTEKALSGVLVANQVDASSNRSARSSPRQGGDLRRGREPDHQGGSAEVQLRFAVDDGRDQQADADDPVSVRSGRRADRGDRR
jgi:YD repeat-containing protein